MNCLFVKYKLHVWQELENQYKSLAEDKINNTNKIRDLQENMLNRVVAQDGYIIDDDDMINFVNSSKVCILPHVSTV